ncbi:helix-turn-helix transcriptional regulator [Jeotgalibacillus soli]|uniref:DeoR family transcriptional regulator n=1 Tax=Jeotgalibacillus soli TaxID=889306 RepID=A0A0C2VKW8_9BACL|nr:metalloregulator ArsR/SmtB family transcription factor [Jeotgalibacillus soli]KIL49512.1 DeoR family transcriptional regulator [Jeotgalibacillus soli]
MNNLSKSTKEKILDLLKKEEHLTVNDLTNRLEITHMAVRKHLIKLEKDGVIATKAIKQPVGRPLQMYMLSKKAQDYFPKNYEGISVDILHDIKEIHGEESVELLFKKREDRLTQEYRGRLDEKTSPREKLNELAAIQNDKGYMAELTEVDENTFELTEYNCPIFSVAKDFKVACRCETELFKNILGTEQINRTCCQTDGDNYCKFLFKVN